MQNQITFFRKVIDTTSFLNLIITIYESLRMLFGSISTVFLLKSGFAPDHIAISKGVLSCVILILDIPLSMLGEAIGHRYLVFFALFFDGIYFILLPEISKPSSLYLVESLNAISLACMSGSFETILLRSKKKDPSYKSVNVLGRTHQLMYLFSSLAGFIGGVMASVPEITCLLSGGGLLALSLAILPVIMGRNAISDLDFCKKEKKNGYLKKSFIVRFSLLFKLKINYDSLAQLVLSSALLSILIQCWQILINPLISIEYKPLYGPLFCAILLAQSFAGKYSMSSSRSCSKSIIAMIFNFLLITYFCWIKSLVTIPLVLIAFFQVKSVSLKFLGILHDDILDEDRSKAHSIHVVFNRLVAAIAFFGISGLVSKNIGLASIPFVLCFISCLILLFHKRNISV